MKRLRGVNLNLMPILHALLHCQNVTRAGEQLGMSQSAVSDALSRLRQLFGDHLLVQDGRDMILTGYAKSLLPMVDKAIEEMEAVFQMPRFRPEDYEGRFVISAPDSVVRTIGPALVHQVLKGAPKATVQFISIATRNFRHLDSGEINIAIVPRRVLPDGYHSADFYDEEFVCIIGKDHPLATKEITEAEYWETPHVTFRPDQQTELTMETSLMAQQNKHQHELVRVSEFSLIPDFVEKLNCIAWMPRRLTEKFLNHDAIEIKQLPFALDPVKLCLVWSDIHHNAPEQRWLRQILLDMEVE